MKFSRQENWGGLPFPSPGDLPDPGIEPPSPTLWADSWPAEPPGKPTNVDIGVGSLSLPQGTFPTRDKAQSLSQQADSSPADDLSPGYFLRAVLSSPAGCKSVCVNFFFLVFNWRIITMLRWFCHTTTSISHNYIYMGFSCGSPGEESTCTAGDPHSVSGSERSPREGHGYPAGLPGEFHGQKHPAVCGSQRVEHD